MTTVAYTFWPTPTFLSGTSFPTGTVTNTGATTRSATRWSSGTSLRASATSRLTPCQPGWKRYSTWGECEPKRLESPVRMVLAIGIPIFVVVVFTTIFVTFYRRRLRMSSAFNRNTALITPIQHTGQVPRPTPILPALPPPSAASDLPHARVTYFRVPPPQSTSDEDLSRAIRISLTDARAVRAARQVHRQPEIEDPPPPYVVAPEIPPYER